MAIDGPVGAGKTSVGRRLARRLGMRFLDSGLTYRALTAVALQRGIAPDDEAAVAELGASIRIEILPDSFDRVMVLVDGNDVTDRLRSPEVDRLVSVVSAMPAVRLHMVRVQREIASAGPIVMVGRDIGTVVLPDAGLKVYLTASDEARARRRFDEQVAAGDVVEFARVLEALRRRDRIDSNRDASPLRPAPDAVIVETDRLTLDEVVEKVAGLAARR